MMKDLARSSGRSSQPYRETSVLDIHGFRIDTIDSCFVDVISGLW